MDYIIHTTTGDELYHHGILGQKWGVRRFQNEDGTRTAAGKAREREGGEKNRFSAKATAYRALAKGNAINERFYGKRGNKLYESMNKSAKEDMLRRADEAQREANANRKPSKESEPDNGPSKSELKSQWKEQRNDFKSHANKGGQVAQFLLTGPAGLYEYNSLRSAGLSPVVAEGVTIASSLCGGMIGQVAVSSLVGASERKKLSKE